jgi:hypothetical protein
VVQLNIVLPEWGASNVESDAVVEESNEFEELEELEVLEESEELEVLRSATKVEASVADEK